MFLEPDPLARDKCIRLHIMCPWISYKKKIWKKYFLLHHWRKESESQVTIYSSYLHHYSWSVLECRMPVSILCFPHPPLPIKQQCQQISIWNWISPQWSSFNPVVVTTVKNTNLGKVAWKPHSSQIWWNFGLSFGWSPQFSS